MPFRQPKIAQRRLKALAANLAVSKPDLADARVSVGTGAVPRAIDEKDADAR